MAKQTESFGDETITLGSREVGALLGTAVFLLTIVNIVVRYLHLEHNRDWLLGFAPLLRVGSETSIPTFYSTTVLLFCGLLLLVIGSTRQRRQEPFAYHWLALGVAFVFLAADEGAGIHERLYPLSNFFLPAELRTTAWGKLPIAGLVLLVGLGFLSFFRALSPIYRRLFTLSILVLFLGGIGMEVIGEDLVRPRYGLRSWSYVLSSSVEELLEMLGGAIFCYSLVLYIERELPDLRIGFGSSGGK